MGTEREILSELQEMNSPLASFPRTMPFAVPFDYFRQAEAELLANVTEQPVSDTQPMPYALPQGYFEQLPGQILNAAKAQQEQTTTQTKKSGRSIWLNLRWAAAALLVVTIGISTYRLSNPAPTIQEQLTEIPYDDLVAYMEDNIDDFETENITNYIDYNSINLSDADISEQAIEDYLP